MLHSKQRPPLLSRNLRQSCPHRNTFEPGQASWASPIHTGLKLWEPLLTGVTIHNMIILVSSHINGHIGNKCVHIQGSKDRRIGSYWSVWMDMRRTNCRSDEYWMLKRQESASMVCIQCETRFIAATTCICIYCTYLYTCVHKLSETPMNLKCNYCASWCNRIYNVHQYKSSNGRGPVLAMHIHLVTAAPLLWASQGQKEELNLRIRKCNFKANRKAFTMLLQ